MERNKNRHTVLLLDFDGFEIKAHLVSFTLGLVGIN